MRTLPILLALTLISCTHDEIDLGDFRLAEGEGEAVAPEGEGGEGGEGGQGEGGGEGGQGEGSEGEGEEGEGEEGEEGEGEEGEGEGAEGEGGGEPKTCGESMLCAIDCGDQDHECLQGCVDAEEFDDRLRIAAAVGCYDDCLGDAWCIERLCGDEEEACRTGDDPPELSCRGAVACHFLCPEGDKDCHSNCDDSTEDASEAALRDWGNCIGPLCEDGDCDPAECAHLLPECTRAGFEPRCAWFCEEHMWECPDGLLPRCVAACREGWQDAFEPLECVENATEGDGCDDNDLYACLPDGGEHPPGPPERRVAVDTDFSDGEEWDVALGGWTFDGEAHVTDCADCPDQPAVAFHPEPMDPQAGWTRVSFTAEGPREVDWAAFAALHTHRDEIRPDDPIERYQGAQVRPMQGQAKLFASTEPDGELGFGVNGFPPEGALRVVATCRGPVGAELFIGDTVGGATFFQAVDWEIGCAPDPAARQHRLALGGSEGVRFANVRYEQLPCDAGSLDELRDGEGPCGVVAHWPFHEDSDNRDHISGGGPIAGDPDIDWGEEGGRQCIFLSGEQGGYGYGAPHGGTSGEWTLEAWVLRRPAPEALRHILRDVAQVPFQQGATNGRAMVVDTNGQLICGAHVGERGAPGARSQGPVPVDEWAHVGCVYEGRRIRAFVNGQPGGTQRAPADYKPSRAMVRIGGDPGQGQQGTFRGGISDVKIHEVAKSEEYFRAVSAR